MKKDDKTAPDQSPKLRRSKSREVGSRFLSPTSAEAGAPSLHQAISPARRKAEPSVDARKHHSSLEEKGFVRGLWPSSTSQSSSNMLGTLADHLGNDRLNDVMERRNNEKLANDNNNSQIVNRQRSCSEFSRFEKEDSSKENHRPIIGRSMRYADELQYLEKPVNSSNYSSLVPGRLSVDENSLDRRRSDSFSDVLDSESDCSDVLFGSPAPTKSSSTKSYLSSTVSSRKSGIEVSSRYMRDISRKLRRGTSDSNIPTPVSVESTPAANKFTLKNAMQRANSLAKSGSAKSQWALSPGRSVSPPVPVENKGKPTSLSNLRPPNSPSRTKRVGKVFTLGLDLFKSKKSSSTCLSPVGHGIGENSHELRLLHNRLIQWRYVNARADAVNQNKTTRTENNLLNAWATLLKLQSSVAQKRIQLQKEKLEMKLNTILNSQVKPLEAWGDMERQHLMAISMTKDCLHSVVCRVPLMEGAKVELQSTFVALRHAADLAYSIRTMLSGYSLVGQKTASLLSELAEVVARERSLLEECFELFEIISALEIQERSLKSNIIQLKVEQQQQEQG